MLIYGESYRWALWAPRELSDQPLGWPSTCPARGSMWIRGRTSYPVGGMTDA